MKAANRADEAAERARQRHEELSQRLHQRTVTVQQTVGTAVDAVTAWTVQHPALVTAEPPTRDEGFSGEGVTEEGLTFWDDEQARTLRDCEPGQALSLLHQFAGQVTANTGLRAGAARSADDRADQDSRDLGSALTWNQDESDHVDSALRAALEVALADSGLLSAHLADDGATTGTWQVSPAADVVHPNLRQYLSADPAHPLAATADQVLRRVRVAATAPAFAAELVIGDDGSFTAGPLRGDRLAADAGSGRRRECRSDAVRRCARPGAGGSRPVRARSGTASPGNAGARRGTCGALPGAAAQGRSASCWHCRGVRHR